MKSIEVIRTPKRAIQMYRTLQVLTNRYNDFVAKFVMPAHKVANLVLTVSGSYGTIRFFGQVNFFAYCAFPGLGIAGLTYANVGYRFGAMINDKANHFRNSWRSQEASETTSAATRAENQEMICVIRSCRDLKLKVGHLYNFEKNTISTYINIVQGNTINLLLAF